MPYSTAAFNAGQPSGKAISLTDLIALVGGAAVEAAAKASHDVVVPFTAKRTDASQEQADPVSFSRLEPLADGFRNCLGHAGMAAPPRMQLVDKAHLLTPSVPEMAVLVGGVRVLNANAGQSAHGVFTGTPETLGNNFLVNRLDMGEGVGGIQRPRTWSKGAVARRAIKWTGTRVDLLFGSNLIVRAAAEIYAPDAAEEAFVNDFVAAWTKVMNPSVTIPPELIERVCKDWNREALADHEQGSCQVGSDVRTEAARS